MGFCINCRSDRPVTEAEADAIERAADAANAGRAWLHCEPVHFYPLEDEDDGHLVGSSKITLQPAPSEVASAAEEGLPLGNCRDMIEVLCQLSRSFGIDWQLSHDYDPDLGAIRAGGCDSRALSQIEALADVGDSLAELDPDAED